MLSDYHKAVVAAVSGGLVAALAVLTGAMTVENTFADIPTVVWLSALSAFIVGSGVTGGAVAVSKANTRSKDVVAVAAAVGKHQAFPPPSEGPLVSADGYVEE